MARLVSLSFATAAQQYVPAHVPPSGQLAYNVIDLLNVHHATADEPLFLNVWAVDEEPADLAGTPLGAADRIPEGGPIPLGDVASGRIFALGARCSRAQGAGFVLSITTDTDATGDPTTPVEAAFQLASD
jgi:hypothetical protein